MGVSVRLKVGQFEVTTDTPEEAAVIMRLFDPNLSAAVSDFKLLERSRPTLTEWTSERLTAFHVLLNDQPLQRRLLNNLYFAGYKGKLKEELVTDLGLENAKQLAGPLSGLAKNAEKIGLAREAVYSMEKLQVKGERTYRYSLNESLILQLQQERQQSAPTTETTKSGELPELRELRNFIRTRRAALFGFMEQGASLDVKGDTIYVVPRNNVYVRYITDNSSIIADLASEFYGRRLKVEIMLPPNTSDGVEPSEKSEEEKAE
jgi:hypothetical protein